MDKLLPYLLLVFLVIVAWNDTLSNRVHRLIGMQTTSTEPEVALAPGPAPTPRRAPFWQDPNYKTGLDKAAGSKKSKSGL